jgi:REP element-mobilizing transposase RayT
MLPLPLFHERKSGRETYQLLVFDAQGNYRFWMETNAPKKIETSAFYLQKLNYIHESPVQKGYVSRPEHWLWSSANPAFAAPYQIAYDMMCHA